MRPTGRLLNAIILWAMLGVVASAWSGLPQAMFEGLAKVPLNWSADAWKNGGTELLRLAWIFGGAALGVFSLLDMVSVALMRPVQIKRKAPLRFALGVVQEVELTVVNLNRSGILVDVFDGIPAECETTEMPWSGKIPGKGYTTVVYPAKLMKRGMLDFKPAHVLLRSPFRFWALSQHAGATDSVRVYPNYEPVIRYSLLAVANRENQMGIKQRNRMGVSREFHQLRDYQEGDVLSQIDWKATSRHLTLISREFREQRDQNIVVMVDSGRRMRAIDGDLPQFDHCLNAILLMSFIALRQGDNVGVLSFGGTNRWLPPIKGQHAMTTLLNHLYDYETTINPSDFGEAAERLMTRQKRRALAIVITNLRSEDSSDIVPALRSMQRNHLVMVASLRESSVDRCLEAPIESVDDAMLYSAANLYLEERKQVFENLSSHGILTVDATAANLPVALTNAYLDVKHSGRL